jgi:hypothetical protein
MGTKGAKMGTWDEAAREAADDLGMQEKARQHYLAEQARRYANAPTPQEVGEQFARTERHFSEATRAVEQFLAAMRAAGNPGLDQGKWIEWPIIIHRQGDWEWNEDHFNPQGNDWVSTEHFSVRSPSRASGNTGAVDAATVKRCLATILLRNGVPVPQD